jgi:hypothetical protein
MSTTTSSKTLYITSIHTTVSVTQSPTIIAAPKNTTKSPSLHPTSIIGLAIGVLSLFLAVAAFGCIWRYRRRKRMLEQVPEQNQVPSLMHAEIMRPDPAVKSAGYELADSPVSPNSRPEDDLTLKLTAKPIKLKRNSGLKRDGVHGLELVARN